MTLEELYETLQQLKLPIAYSHFKSPQEPPYLVYLMEDTNNFGADNKVYHRIENLVIELYTIKKDITLEKKLEALLNEKELYYEKVETYIESEKLYEVRYEL